MLDYAGRRTEQTNQYKQYQQEKIALKSWAWFNLWRWLKLGWINIKIWGWRKFGQKNVHTHNEDAMVETLCTELFGAIAPGQVQHISLMESHYSNGQPKSMPLCRWQPGLKTFTGAVSGPEKMKQLAKNGVADPRFVDVGMFLALMLLALDYDGVGSQCQNKGYIERNGQYHFFAFDIGHFGTGINTLLQTLQVDFSFIAPRKFKNLTIFQDFDIVQKMAGVYLLYCALPESLKLKWFSQEKRLAIEAAIDEFARQNEQFHKLTQQIKPGHVERIFDRYFRTYRRDRAKRQKIEAIRSDLHKNMQKIFAVMAPRLGLAPQHLALLQNLQSLCSKTATHHHGIRQRHLLTIKNRVLWEMKPLNNNRFQLNAVVKNKRQAKKLKNRLAHFFQTRLVRKKSALRLVRTNDTLKLVMTVTASELKQITAATTENAVRQYKAIYLSGNKQQIFAKKAGRGRANSMGCATNTMAPLKKAIIVQDQSQTVVPQKKPQNNQKTGHFAGGWLYSSGDMPQAVENHSADAPTIEQFKHDNF